MKHLKQEIARLDRQPPKQRPRQVGWWLDEGITPRSLTTAEQTWCHLATELGWLTNGITFASSPPQYRAADLDWYVLGLNQGREDWLIRLPDAMDMLSIDFLQAEWEHRQSGSIESCSIETP